MTIKGLQRYTVLVTNSANSAAQYFDVVAPSENAANNVIQTVVDSGVLESLDCEELDN